MSGGPFSTGAIHPASSDVKANISRSINNSLTAWLNGLSGSNALLLGAILGFMCSFDLGGPVNKAAYAFCLGAMANGVYGPYAIFASVKMVSAFTVTASTMLAPRLFKEFEIETGKSTWLLGLAGITEGAIPMAIEDRSHHPPIPPRPD